MRKKCQCQLVAVQKVPNEHSHKFYLISNLTEVIRVSNLRMREISTILKL